LLLLPSLSLSRYELGTVDANNKRKVLAVDPALPYVFTGLPVGPATLFVCASDAYGARVCATQDVTVQPAAADFKVSDALTAFDVNQLAGARDVAVMAAGAQALHSLSQYADTAAATQTAAEKAQVQSAIAAKTSAMIGQLANDVSSYIDDPNTMSQVSADLGCYQHVHVSTASLPQQCLCLCLETGMLPIGASTDRLHVLAREAQGKPSDKLVLAW
jgi:hypothetical protein